MQLLPRMYMWRCRTSLEQQSALRMRRRLFEQTARPGAARPSCSSRTPSFGMNNTQAQVHKSTSSSATHACAVPVGKELANPGRGVLLTMRLVYRVEEQVRLRLRRSDAGLVAYICLQWRAFAEEAVRDEPPTCMRTPIARYSSWKRRRRCLPRRHRGLLLELSPTSHEGAARP